MTQFSLPPPQLPSQQLKVGSAALQSSGPLHQARGSVQGLKVPRAWWWWWWWRVLLLEITENKNHRWLGAGSHPDHILFGCSIDSIVPILANKRTCYAGLQKRDVMSEAGKQPGQRPRTGQHWSAPVSGRQPPEHTPARPPRLTGGAGPEHPVPGPRGREGRQCLGPCLLPGPPHPGPPTAGSRVVVEGMSEQSASPGSVRKCRLSLE